MAKNRTTGGGRSGKAQAGDCIDTIHGERVPVAELEHIAPHLRAFAVRVDSLVRDPNNARLHGEEDLPATAASLQRFGQQHLLQFEPQSRIIKIGNGRHEAAERILGWTWIAAAPSNLSAEELRAFALADNRTAEKSAWDIQALEHELDALQNLGFNDLETLGFGDRDLLEIERSLSSVADAVQQSWTDDVEEEPPPDPVQKTIEEMDRLKQARRQENERVAEKNDTEKFLVLVFRSRRARAAVLKAIGLPDDERYVPADAVEIRLRPGAHLEPTSLKSADFHNTMAGG